MPEDAETERPGFFSRLFGRKRVVKKVVKRETEEQTSVAPTETPPTPARPPLAVDMNDNPDFWNPRELRGMDMTPQQVPGKRPVVPAPSEDDLDDVEEDEEDGEEDEGEDEDDEEDDEDDEDDDEDEDEPEPPEPLRPPIPGKPKIGRPKKPQKMSRDDLRTIIVERFEQGWTSYEVYNWLNDENIIDETGEPLSVKQVGGYKSMVSSQRREAYVSGQAPPPLAGQMQPLPPDYVAPPMAPARPTQGSQQQPFNIPRPRTNLEIHYEKLEKAVADKNDAMAQIAVEGLYKEMEKDGSGGGGGGMNTQLFQLLQAQLAGNKGSSKLHELEQLTTIVKNLMPEQAQGESEAVGMARVMADTVEKVSKDAKDTILEVSGTKGKADNMGTCPNCKKIIPKDSLFCGYCGLNFQKVEDDEEEEEEDEEEAEARKEQERIEKEKARRAELARKAVKAPAAPPKPTAAPPQQPPKAGTPPAARPPAATPPQVRPLEPPVQIGVDGGVMTVTERASLLRDLKKLANFITNKDDPVLKTQALFKLGDDGDKKQTLFLAIVGRDLLLASARRMVQEHPTELSMFQNYIELCDSVDGHAWLDKCFEEIKNLSKQYGVMLKREEAAAMLAKMEAKLGFSVE